MLLPELKLWRKDILEVSNFFRSSQCHSKSLEEFGVKIEIKILAFPKHFEVRFAEHLKAVVKAVISNICRRVWMSIVDSKDATKTEKAETSELLNT